jgi:hypothetical protein
VAVHRLPFGRIVGDPQVLILVIIAGRGRLTSHPETIRLVVLRPYGELTHYATARAGDWGRVRADGHRAPSE